MRILSTADWHLGEFPGPVVDGQNARLMDTVRCLDFLVEQAEQEQPDAILIAGDLFNKSQMWASPMLNLIDIAVSRLRRLAAIAPTVLMYGTANHDSLDAFQNIDSMLIPNLYIATNPDLLTIQTKSGPLQVAAVPGLDKGHFRAQYPGMDPTEENATCSKLLGDLVLGLGAQVDPAIPSVLMSHYTVAGCEYDNGQVSIFNNSEVILPKEALAASPFDLVCLGHIHKAQEVPGCGRPTFYSGPLNGLTFNEEGQDKGFWMHEIKTDLPYDNIESKFIKTPAREFLTLEIDFRESVDLQHDLKWELAGISDTAGELLVFPTTGKIVRLHYQCTEEQKKQISHKEMEKLLYHGGAFFVSEIKPVQITTALSKQEMTENAGPLENLSQWLQKEGFTEDETQAIVALANPLIEAVSARMPTGKLSGVFVPRSLKVKNYRSYREAEFDFNPVTFATVNGPNGAGKSAFFMDAIRDCLYEETREGDLTGWITAGQKSGMLDYEFGMGESIWQVIRTRARSGKTTLALQEQVDGEWQDRSADKVRDTQEKIVTLLGMDALTFCCCGLIMQDAYGLFLEADREDRMSVLGNILGLGVYEQLTEMAKNKVTDTNRELQKAKDKLAELDEKLKAAPGLKSELVAVGAELAQVAGDIAGKEEELKEAEELVRVLEAKAEKARELEERIKAATDEVTGFKTQKAGFEERLNKANTMIAREDEIVAKAKEYERVKQQVTVLQVKKPRLAELSGEINRTEQEISRADGQIKRLALQMREIEQLLENRGALEKVAAEYREAVTALEYMDGKVDKYNDLISQRQEIETVLDQKKTKKGTLKQEIKSLQNRALMLENSNCIDPEKASCRFLADAVESKAKMPTTEAQIVALDIEIAPMDEQAAELTKQIDDLGYKSHEHRRLREQVAELRPKAEQVAQLNAKEELLTNLQEQKRQAQETKTAAAERLSTVREQARELAKELEPLAALEASLPNLEKWVKAKEQLPAAKQAAETATERIAELDREIRAKTEQVDKLGKERHLLLVETVAIDGSRSNADNLRGYIKELQDNQNALHVKQGGLKAKLEALEKDEAERRQVAEQMAPTAATLTRYQTLAKAFGQDGIPFSIVRTVVPELSAQANEILGQMTGGKMSLEMKTERVLKSNKKEVNALEIWINDYQWGNMPYKSRSGGQKVRAALSVAFALAELKARRAGIQLGMLAIDEPPFQDQAGTEAYVDALETIATRYADMKVIAISHDPEFKARFPQVIMVEDGGEAGSRVRLVA